ncbi:MAG: hypothetical protein WCR04_07680 [Fibrobacteraceae bacterium]
MKKILFLLLLSLMALSACRNSEKSDSDAQSSVKQTSSLPKNLRPVEELSPDAPQKKEVMYDTIPAINSRSTPIIIGGPGTSAKERAALRSDIQRVLDTLRLR